MATPRLNPTLATSARSWAERPRNPDLFLAVLLDVGLHCLLSIASGMNRVATRDVSMVCRRFMVASRVMLSGFSVVMRRLREVF